MLRSMSWLLAVSYTMIISIEALREPELTGREQEVGAIICTRISSDFCCQLAVQPQFPGLHLDQIPAESHDAEEFEMPAAKVTKGANGAYERKIYRRAIARCHDTRETLPGDSPLTILKLTIIIKCQSRRTVNVRSERLSIALVVHGQIVTESKKAFCELDERENQQYQERLRANRARDSLRLASEPLPPEEILRSRQRKASYMREYRNRKRIEQELQMRATVAAEHTVELRAEQVNHVRDMLTAGRSTAPAASLLDFIQQDAVQQGSQDAEDVAAESSRFAEIRDLQIACSDVLETGLDQTSASQNHEYAGNIVANIDITSEDQRRGTGLRDFDLNDEPSVFPHDFDLNADPVSNLYDFDQKP